MELSQSSEFERTVINNIVNNINICRINLTKVKEPRCNFNLRVIFVTS